MNVLHLHESIELKGGSEVYIDLLCKYLPAAGVDSAWIAITRGSHNYIVEHAVGGREEIAFDDVNRYLQKIITESKIDIFHIHGITDPALIQECLSLLPVVRSMHEPRLFCPGAQKFWLASEEVCKVPFGVHCLYHAYTQKCCNRSPARLAKAFGNTKFELSTAVLKYKALIAMSEYMKHEAVSAGVDDDKVHVIPYFVEERSAASYNQNQPLRIVFIGRLHESKGVHYLLRAFEVLCRSLKTDVSLDIIGSGSFEPALRVQAESLGISDKVHFKGWLSRAEIYEAIDSAYIMAVPSIYPEAFGIVGIEAMMAGKPVVGYNNGGISQWLIHNETGFCVTSKDVDALAESMRILFQYPVVYERMSQHARRLALEHYTPATHISRLVAVYQEAILD